MQTATLSPDPIGDHEAPCSDCVVNRGLCRRHESHVLPQLALPSWPRMIGEPYVCTEPRCEEHVLCIHTRSAAPRALCDCHNCSQKRWAKARAKEQDEPTPAGMKAARRNDRKRDRAASRLATAMNGGFTRSRPTRTPTRTKSTASRSAA